MWINGTTKIGETEFTYQAKQYDLGSEFGINGGRISKLEIRRGGRTVAHYDRVWDIRPVDKETEEALAHILDLHNTPRDEEEQQ